MSDTLLVILISIGAVALFVAGLSLTLIFKGHNIRSEIGENEDMRRRGITCAAGQMRREECELRGATTEPSRPAEDCPAGGCAGCGAAKP